MCSCTSAPSRRRATASLNENDKVEFEVSQGPKGPQAGNVRRASLSVSELTSVIGRRSSPSGTG